MENYNFKVVAELRNDLSEMEKASALKEMNHLKDRLHIVNLDNVTYCKAQPIQEYDDFGAVAFFFSGLKRMKNCFSKLEYHDMRGHKKHVAV